METHSENKEWSNEVSTGGWFEWFTRKQNIEENKALEIVKYK